MARRKSELALLLESQEGWYKESTEQLSEAQTPKEILSQSNDTEKKEEKAPKLIQPCKLSQPTEKPFLELRESDLVEITPSIEYEIIEKLAKGTFGVVYHASDSSTLRKMALKFIKNVTEAQNEIENQNELSKCMAKDHSGCRFLSKMIGNYIYKGHHCLTFDLLGQSLHDYMYKEKEQGKRTSARTFSVNDIKLIAYQALMALKFLHRHNIVHTDIKPQNLVFANAIRSRTDMRIKLIDFGSAYIGTKPQSQDAQPKDYRSPEAIIGSWHKECDVWGLAAVCYELFRGVPLFDLKVENVWGNDEDADNGEEAVEMKADLTIFDLGSIHWTELDNCKHLAIIERLIGPLEKKLFLEKDYDWCRKKLDKIGSIKGFQAFLQKVYNPESVFYDGGSEQVGKLFDLLKECLIIDVKLRMTVEKALADPFFGDVDRENLTIKPSIYDYLAKFDEFNANIKCTKANAKDPGYNIRNFELYFLAIPNFNFTPPEPKTREKFKNAYIYVDRDDANDVAIDMYNDRKEGEKIPYNVGDIVMVKYGLYPFWPAMIQMDRSEGRDIPEKQKNKPVKREKEENPLLGKFTDMKDGTRQYNLHYLGPLLCQGWTSSDDIVGKYEGWENYKRDCLLPMFMSLLSKEESHGEKAFRLNRFVTSECVPNQENDKCSIIPGMTVNEAWQISMQEAEWALDKSNAERIRKFTYEYVHKYTPDRNAEAK